MRQAVCVLFKIPDDPLYVVVSRPNDITKWGFPGGKSESGEALAEAAVREVFEELGLRIDASDLDPVYTGPCAGDVFYETTAFVYTGAALQHQSIKMEDGLTFGYATREELSSQEFSPFSDYNNQVFEAIERQIDGRVRFYDDASGATLHMDRYYGFTDSGGLAGSFDGYDNALGASVHIKTQHDGDFSYRAEELGSAAICILTGQEYVNRLRQLEPADPDHIDTYGRFVK